MSAPNPDIVHVQPVNDLQPHVDEGCPCQPAIEEVPRDDGTSGWLFTHNAWDGRE